MTLPGIIARGRKAHEGVMTEQGTLARVAQGDHGTFDPTTQKYTSGDPDPVYTGKARVRPAGKVGGASEGEDGAVMEYDYLVKFPAGTDVRRGDSFTVTASSFDPQMATDPLIVWVADVQLDGWQVTRNAKCTNEVVEVTP